MIHTSDGESFEDEVGHVFGQDMMADNVVPMRNPANDNKPLSPDQWLKMHPNVSPPTDTPPQRTAEYKGIMNIDEWNSTWSAFHGTEQLEQKQLDENLVKGPIAVPRNHPKVKEYLKNNPDTDTYDFDRSGTENWQILKRQSAPLVG